MATSKLGAAMALAREARGWGQYGQTSAVQQQDGSVLVEWRSDSFTGPQYDSAVVPAKVLETSS